jgi:hypothetical protein
MNISGNSPLAPPNTHTPTRASSSAPADRAVRTPESLQEKNLRNLDAVNQQLENLREASSPNQQAIIKLELMRRRLDTMLFALRFATPRQAREMARELRSMAKEMAAIARSLKNGGGGGGAQAFTLNLTLPNTAAATAGGDPTASAGAAALAARQAETAASQAAARTSAAQEAAGETAEATDEASGAATVEAGSVARTAGNGIISPHPSRSGASASSLRKALSETSRQLKLVLGMLKSRLNDKESRKNMAETEKYLKYVENVLSQGYLSNALSPGESGGSGFYDVQGAPVSAEAPAAIDIDVHA